MANSAARTIARSTLSFAFGALAVFFAVTAAIAVWTGSAGPIVVLFEVLIAGLFGALFHVMGRR